MPDDHAHDWQRLDGAPFPAGVVDLWVINPLTGKGQRMPDCRRLQRSPGGWVDAAGHAVEVANLAEATHWMRAPGGPASE